MDVLSEILISLRIEAAAIATFILGGSWSFCNDDLDAAYSYSIMDGQCWFAMDGAPSRLLGPGDSVLVPRGGVCYLSSALDLEHVSLKKTWINSGLPDFERRTFIRPVTLRVGNGQPNTRMLGIAFSYTESANLSLLRSLPPFFFIEAEHRRYCPWLTAIMEFLGSEAESSKPGYAAMAQELAALVFTSLLRAHVLNVPGQGPGLLAGLNDRNISSVLSTIHASPNKAWSLNQMAACAGMSRSAFTARFQSLMGESAMSYLINLRMRRAADQLCRTRVKVSDLARQYGYRSERAFREAFKAYIGVSPRDLRRNANIKT